MRGHMLLALTYKQVAIGNLAIATFLYLLFQILLWRSPPSRSCFAAGCYLVLPSMVVSGIVGFIAGALALFAPGWGYPTLLLIPSAYFPVVTIVSFIRVFID